MLQWQTVLRVLPLVLRHGDLQCNNSVYLFCFSENDYLNVTFAI